MTVALAGAVLATGALAPAAHAGTARVELHCEEEPDGLCSSEIRYEAGAGERNDVVVDTGGSEIAIEDRTATVAAGRGCTAVDAHRVLCDIPSADDYEVLVLVGDGNDTVTAAGFFHKDLRGGTGDDTLIGGEQGDRLDGGPGADLLDGAAGHDEVSYRSRTKGVLVDLTGGRTSGGRGEGDRLVRLESAEGGRGDDRIVGTDVGGGFGGRAGDDRIVAGAGEDTIFGDAGDDLLEGGDGDDELAGGSERDLMLGGAGDDSLYGGAGVDDLRGGAGNDGHAAEGGHEADRVSCGGGFDGVGYPGRSDLVLRDCERVEILYARIVALPPLESVHSPVLRLRGILDTDRVTCWGRDCIEITLRLAGGGPVVARHAVSRERPRDLPPMDVRLAPAGAELLRRRGSLRVVVTVSVLDSRRRVQVGGFTTVLRAP